MSRPRKFDHDECRALYATGEWTMAALARRYEVKTPSVRRIVNADYAEMQRSRQRSFCGECGRPCSWNRSRQGSPRCRLCAAKACAKVSGGRAYCATCGTWKPLDQFANSAQRPARGVHGECRPCSTVRRRATPIVHRADCNADSRCRSCGVVIRNRHRVGCAILAYQGQVAA